VVIKGFAVIYDIVLIGITPPAPLCPAGVPARRGGLSKCHSGQTTFSDSVYAEYLINPVVTHGVIEHDTLKILFPHPAVAQKFNEF
jgi:hypothetical protein